MKYIVYLTVNINNEKVYIGVHKTGSTIKFDGYLGCGVWTHDKVRIENSKNYFRRAVKKHGAEAFRRTTIAVFKTAEEAYNLEAVLVNEAFVDRSDTYNSSLGGVENRKPHKKVLQYSKEGFYIETWKSSEEAATVLKSSAAAIRKACVGGTLACKGYQWRYWSETKVEKLPSVLNRGKAIRVAQYFLDGQLIKEWKSAHEAGKVHDVKGEVIVRNAKYGKQVVGYQWRLILEDRAEALIEPFVGKSAIAQLDLDYNLIRVWNRYAEVSKAGFNNVKRAVNTPNKTIKGFRWMTLELYISTYKNKYKSRIQGL